MPGVAAVARAFVVQLVAIQPSHLRRHVVKPLLDCYCMLPTGCSELCGDHRVDCEFVVAAEALEVGRK